MLKKKTLIKFKTEINIFKEIISWSASLHFYCSLRRASEIAFNLSFI